MERTQFTWYGSFSKAAKRINDMSQRCLFYETIADYALYGTLPDMDSLPDSVAMAFELVKPNLDASRRKAENGRRGGAARNSGSKPEANRSKPKQTGSKKEKEKEKE